MAPSEQVKQTGVDMLSVVPAGPEADLRRWMKLKIDPQVLRPYLARWKRVSWRSDNAIRPRFRVSLSHP